jgi:hypothetical protein
MKQLRRVHTRNSVRKGDWKHGRGTAKKSRNERFNC